MNPDHEAALAKCRAWPHKSNTAACYLDAMARLDKATELLRELVDGLVPCNEPAEPGSVVARVCAFLERKTDDKQS